MRCRYRRMIGQGNAGRIGYRNTCKISIFGKLHKNFDMKNYTIFPKHLSGVLLLACLFLFTAAKNDREVAIYMIGDSTMANKDLTGGNPERGWGFVLPGFFSEKVYIENHAMNGRSTKSFIDEGRWQTVLDRLQKGDYVFIQFGHNDAKPDTARHTDPGSTFDDNLRRFVNESRSKGAIPVLFNSIVRRHFEDGQLTDTHGEYREVPARIAAELQVPYIDMNRLTHDWVQALGDEPSRAYFMWVEKNTLACCPKGKQDNTHLNVRGARAVAAMAVNALRDVVPALVPYMREADWVVAQDGSGDFFTVQEAVNAVPDYRQARTRIIIRTGIYKEKLVIPASKTNLSLIGESGVVITGDDYADKLTVLGEKMGTSGSATCYIYAPDFHAENITFENTAGRVGQAVAVLADGDRMVFRNCRFLGNQDTLYAKGQSLRDARQYYDHCYIEGNVDFIFGWATAVFDRCTIHSNRSKSYVTAPATYQDSPYGFVFLNCRLTADEGVERVFLARPWRRYGQCVYIGCEMGKHIIPEGWNSWPSRKEKSEKTAFFAEYGTTGEGANPKARVKWSHQLKNDKDYTVEKILGGNDGWDPRQVK